MTLTGKRVLITGGRRVGGNLARQLADRGASVAMTFHSSRETIEQTIAEARGRGVQGLAVAADLSRAEDAERTITQVVETFGGLDALINMASVYRRTPFASLKPGDLDAMLAGNLAATYHTSVFAARQMLKQEGEDGIKGRIINLGDWATERPYTEYLPYLVAKGAVTTLTLALAKELAPHILVNLIQPAMIDPPAGMTQEEINRVVQSTPLKRIGTPEDVNRLILYLLEGTNFATGACFRVDGGRFLGRDDA